MDTKQHGPQATTKAVADESAPQLYNPLRTLATDRPIWTRQPNETDKEWSWFCLFRNLHPATRSVNGAYRKYREACGEEWTHKNAPHLLQDMSRKWSWAKRAAEYDAYIDTEYNVALVQARETALKEVAELGRNMRKVAAIAVQALHQDLYDRVRDPETGEIVTVFKERLTPAAIVRLAKTGVELERVALGMEDMRPSAGSSVNVQVAVAAGTAPRQLLRTDDDLLRTAAEIIEASRMQKQVLEGEYEFVEKSPTAQVKVAITKSSPQS